MKKKSSVNEPPTQPLHPTSSGGTVPIPDPTLLTTQMTWREIGALKELLETRLDAMDEALNVARNNYTRVPTDIDKAIGPLRELLTTRLETIDERFSGVSQRFEERDLRFKQVEEASKDAVAAALQSAREANAEQAKNFASSIDKSEAALNKQIEGIAQIAQTGLAAQAAVSADLKDRMTRIESGMEGARGQRVEARAESGALWVVVGGVLGVAGFLVAASALIAK